MPDPLIEHTAAPSLEDPVMIAAFRGWNDAGDSASFAAEHLGRIWSAERFASIDPEEFFDFQAVRPRVELIDGHTRHITWPANDFFAAHLEGTPPAILLVGTEPNTRWRTFSDLIVDVARTYDVKMVITLGALLADVPHSRPVPITGTAVDQDLIDKLGLQRSRYEGPTGIVGVLHDSLGRAGISSASLWAAVPHYLAITPNPKAAFALLEKTGELLESSIDITSLRHAADAYEERVTDMVASDEDVQAYVRLLEERADERARQEEIELPTGDALAAELERFLRERDESGPGE
ncbi:MAG TPA: PAC2 family protein [Actinomycetota bacterium]|nr:PAC2 family protein [Actinomycetota bacterium]